MSRNYGVNVNNTKKSQQSVETFESKNNAELCKQLSKRTSDLEKCREAIIFKGVEVPEGTDTSEYGDKIRAISTGIVPTGKKTITENGTDIDVAQYATADVNVPQGIPVNESYDISEGTLNSATITLEGDVTAHIPDGVTTIGMGAFMDNTVIERVIMPDSIETIEDGNFYGVSAFYQCSRLKNVEFSNHLTSIGDYAFFGCSGLTSITIPDSVTSIGDYAFSDCSSLTSITIPDSVTSIGDGAFGYCSGLTSITIPDSVTSIGDGAFSNCTSLTDIYYTGTQAEWEAITGISSAGIPEGATIHYEYTPT